MRRTGQMMIHGIQMFLSQNKVLMIFADMYDEILSLFEICNDKIGFTENSNQTCFSSNWTCFKQSGYESGNGHFITWNDSRFF